MSSSVRQRIHVGGCVDRLARSFASRTAFDDGRGSSSSGEDHGVPRRSRLGNRGLVPRSPDTVFSDASGDLAPRAPAPDLGAARNVPAMKLTTRSLAVRRAPRSRPLNHSAWSASPGICFDEGTTPRRGPPSLDQRPLAANGAFEASCRCRPSRRSARRALRRAARRDAHRCCHRPLERHALPLPPPPRRCRRRPPGRHDLQASPARGSANALL